MSNTRVILVHNEKCSNSCSHCYYKHRDHRTGQSIDRLYEFIDTYHPDKVAIGLNPGHHIEEWEILLDVIEYCTDTVVTVSMDWDLIEDIIYLLPNNEVTLCITYDPTIDISYRVVEDIQGATCNKVLNITDNYISENTQPESFSRLANTVDGIYLLMTKGPVGRWQMTNARIEEYIKRLEYLKSITITPVLVDECVHGVMTKGIGNCKEDWLEVNSHGEVRTCPYSIEPDYTYRYGIDVSNVEFPTMCKCRSSNYEGELYECR